MQEATPKYLKNICATDLEEKRLLFRLPCILCIHHLGSH